MADNLIQMLEGLRGLGALTNEGWDDWSPTKTSGGGDFYTPPADYVTANDDNPTFEWSMPNDVPLKPGWSTVDDVPPAPTTPAAKPKPGAGIPWKMALGAVAVAAAAWWAFGSK